MNNRRPFIVIILEPSSEASYQTDTGETQDYAFTSVAEALEHVSALLADETISITDKTKVIILNTEDGATHGYSFKEEPRKFIWKAI